MLIDRGAQTGKSQEEVALISGRVYFEIEIVAKVVVLVGSSHVINSCFLVSGTVLTFI